MNQVVPAGNTALEGRGASYYLPRTVVVASIAVIKTTVEAGDFADYSLPLFRIKPEVTESATSFTLGDEMTLDLTGERDSKQRFIALNPKGPFKTFSRTMTFNEQGVLAKGDASVENKTFEASVSTVETVAKIATSAIKLAGGNVELFPESPGLERLRDHVNSLDKRPDHMLTHDGLRAGLNVLLAANPDHYLADLKKQEAFKVAAANWEDFAENCPKGFREMSRAIEAAKQIRILVDKVESAWPAAERAALQAERDNLLAKFTGKKSEKKTWAGQFRWVPASRSSEIVSGPIKIPQTLFVLGDHGGIAWGPKIKPEVPPSESFSTNQSDGKTFSVSLLCESIIPPETPVWQALLSQRKKHGWHYRVPAQAKVSLLVNDIPRVTRRCQIAQHGCVAFVPATTSSQKIVSNVELDPVTGALKSTVHGGQAFDPNLINRSGAAVAGVIDTEKARAKAEATANDPATQLERKKKLLQLEKDIRALEQSP